MRIVIAVSGSHGDVRPIMALGKYLKSYGHSVLICAAPEDEEFVLKHGLEFKAVGKHCSYMFDKLLEEKSKLKWGGIMAEYLREEVSLQFDQLPDAVIGCGYDTRSRPSVCIKVFCRTSECSLQAYPSHAPGIEVLLLPASRHAAAKQPRVHKQFVVDD